MRMISSWLGNGGKPVATKRGNFYQARWRVLADGASQVKECKRTDFATKAKARYFLTELEKAHYGLVDAQGRTWRFDESGQPTNLRAGDTTVMGAIDLYVKSRWSSEWQAAQRAKVRGRMLRVAIQLTNLSASQKSRLIAALEAQRGDRGARPVPVTREEWAARWLRDCAFLPGDEAVLDTEMAAAKGWLEQHSMPLRSFSFARVTALRVVLIGKDGSSPLEHGTRRAYWSGVVVPFLNWLYEVGMVESSPMRGQKNLRRDSEGELPDPNLILEPEHVALLADWFRRHYGETWALFPLIATFCALRIGEALFIRLSDFTCRDGQWYLHLKLQIHATTKSCSDNGTGKEIRPTKSQRDVTPRARIIPLPPSVAGKLVELFGERLGRDETHLFRGPRGAVGNATDVRKWWKQALKEVVVPVAPRFAGCTPHVMRHTGMTYWFAMKIDHKRIQDWGGWKSLVVMLDTYLGVLASLETVDLSKLHRFDETWTLKSNKPTSDDEEKTGATITDLATWRLTRGA